MELLPSVEDQARRAVGIYDFWGRVEVQLHIAYVSQDDQAFEPLLQSVATYLNWYAERYKYNEDMHTAFYVAFIEHAAALGYFNRLHNSLHGTARAWTTASTEVQPPHLRDKLRGLRNKKATDSRNN